MPEITFFHRFRDFMEMADQRKDEFHRIVAHPVPDQPFTAKPAAEKILLTVGPEGGFLPSEVAAFENCGFQKFSCGRHILRVEFACAFLCGMLI
jgi:RsmE family RNA methyltransferase